jgi:salicylate hydroxylase
VLVVGAGIGGLAAAICARRLGLDVTVYEQADELREVGAGIQLAPNATRILHGLGLAEPLARVAARPAAAVLRRWDDGRQLWSQPLGDAIEGRFGAPYYHLYRPDLLAVLGAALPADAVRLGHRVVAIEDGPAGIALRFADGAGAEGDAVVGADGIHSVVRARAMGADAPRFSGSIAYRGLVPADRVADLRLPVVSNTWLGPERHFVHYFVAAARLLNWVAIVPGRGWQVESWSATGEIADALAEFAGWHGQVRAIIGAADRTHRWALYDREPLPRWTAGRATLLGDAAHAMLPFLAQGACQAIEDAVVLARCLTAAAPATVPAALARYEAIRKPRASRVQAGSRGNATTYHLPDGPAQRERDAAYTASMAVDPFAARGWLFEHDAAAEAGAVAG